MRNRKSERKLMNFLVFITFMGLCKGIASFSVVKANSSPIEQWSYIYGGSEVDYGESVQQTLDGGYIVVGFTESFGEGDEDVYMIKTDSEGNMIWDRTFGGSEKDGGLFVQLTSDEGYVLTGYTNSFGGRDYDIFVIRTDSDGNMLWNKTYGGAESDRGFSIQETSDGGYALACGTGSYGAGGFDAYLIRTDSEGNMLWNRTYGGSDSDASTSFQQTADGGYILGGYTQSFGSGSYDFYLVRTDSDGNMLWNRTYGGSEIDWSYSVQQTSDGGYILAGFTESFDAGNRDFYLVKTDSEGNVIWDRTFGGSERENCYSIQQTPDNGYILAGYTESYGAGDFDVYLVRTDSDGNMLWNRTYGGSKMDFGEFIQLTSNGGYIITGFSSSFGAGDTDIYLLKLSFIEDIEEDTNDTKKIPGFPAESLVLAVAIGFIIFSALRKVKN